MERVEILGLNFVEKTSIESEAVILILSLGRTKSKIFEETLSLRITCVNEGL